MGEDIKWNEKKFQKELIKELAGRFAEIAASVESQVVESISIGQPTRITKSGNKIGLSPSLPGDPPKVLYGDLRGSFFHDIKVKDDLIIARVASVDDEEKVLSLEYNEAERRDSLNRPFFRNKLWSKKTARVVKHAMRKLKRVK